MSELGYRQSPIADHKSSMSKFPGGHRGRVTPVPIPNTEVKPATADGTACAGVWESRSLPGLFSERLHGIPWEAASSVEAAFFLYAPRDRVIGLTRLHGAGAEFPEFRPVREPVSVYPQGTLFEQHSAGHRPPTMRPATHRTLLVVLTGLFLLVGGNVAQARPARPAPPLPAPSGPIVNVSTEPQLQAAVRAIASQVTIVLAPGTYRLTRSLSFSGPLKDIGIRGATGNSDD